MKSNDKGKNIIYTFGKRYKTNIKKIDPPTSKLMSKHISSLFFFPSLPYNKDECHTIYCHSEWQY